MVTDFFSKTFTQEKRVKQKFFFFKLKILDHHLQDDDFPEYLEPNFRLHVVSAGQSIDRRKDLFCLYSLN